MVGTTNRSMAAMSGAWLRRKMHQPWLTNGDRLFLVQLYRWFPSVLHSGFSALICRINARRSAAIFGRPPREQDFQRQYRRKPARCQRTRVSGRMIVMALMGRRSTSLANVLRYARLSDLERELWQLAMDARRTRTRPRTIRSRTI